MEKSMLGKWDKWYKNIKHVSSFRYGNTITYQLAANFLSDMDTVEDWGCGTGGFRRVYKGNYIGIDGSVNPFVDKVADLREYRSNVDGIMMRHVLEHNYDWKLVLNNAITSFRKKLCIVLFTPFSEETRAIADNSNKGVNVPDMSFSEKEFEECLTGLKWRKESHKTKTVYGIEHIYYIEKTKNNIAVISANMGSIDKTRGHAEQSIPYDYFLFNEHNFPPRENSMLPRLQSKIPKMFAWQMVPGYEYYIWLDRSITMVHPDTVKWLLDKCKDVDFALFKHDKRTTIEREARRTQIGIKQGSTYLYTRYHGELIDDQIAEITANKDFIDNELFLGGIFIYHNIPEVHEMLKDWWYHVSRYSVQDQISLPYVLKKSKIKYNKIDELYYDCKYFSHRKHK